MGKLDLWLDDEDVKDAQSSGSFLFAIPSDAARRGNFEDPNDDKAKASWVQALEITESKQYEDKAKDKDGNEYDCITFELTFQVPPNTLRPKTGEPDPNSGKQHKAWYRIVPAAMKNKQHPKYKANNFNNGKLTGIVRAIWGSSAFPVGQKINLGDFFGTDAVVNQTVIANMKARKYEGEPQNEIVDFVPREMVDA